MISNAKQDIANLTARWHQTARRGGANESVTALLDALLHDRFDFQAEAWLGAGKSDAREMLLRAWDAGGADIPQGSALKRLFEEGLLPGLDKFLVFAALRKVDPDGHSAITLNALPSTLASPAFWAELEDLPHGHAADRIVFEVLEYETDYVVNDTLMRAACAKGYRFALDDFTPEAGSWERLADFAPYLAYIKLDGSFVRSGFAGNPVFAETVKTLRERYPDLDIIAEHVETPHEARTLFASGIAVVQGRALPSSPRALRP